MRPAWCMTIGYIGPKSKPMKETATASPMRERTRQMTTSSLRNYEHVRGAGGEDARDGQQGVKKDNTTFSELPGTIMHASSKQAEETYP